MLKKKICTKVLNLLKHKKFYFYNSQINNKQIILTSLKMNMRQNFQTKLNCRIKKFAIAGKFVKICYQSGHYNSIYPFFLLKQQSLLEHLKFNNCSNIKKFSK